MPVAVMTYYNIVFRAGHRRMARSLAAAGVTGAIIPDLPIEEIGPWATEADAAGVDTVLLVAPSSPPERVARICARARGLRLCRGPHGGHRRAGRAGVGRGEGGRADPRAAPTCRCASASVSPPPTQAAEVCEVADGVVVGSALVRRLLEGEGPEGAAAFVRSLREAID